jgi:serine protease Do
MTSTPEFDARATDYLGTELADLADHLRRSTVQVRGSRFGGGSGVIWSSDGLVITNAHVAPNRSAEVELSDGREYKAAVIDRSPDRDLAALRIVASDLPAAAVGDSDAVRVGQLAFAVGNPLGIIGALTSGIIHATGPVHPRARHNWLQADIRIMPGNSGGPLADATGAVIGINSMVAGSLALAVPSAAVARFLGIAEARPTLGISYEPVFIREGRRGTYGVLVLDVRDGSPAANAGLMLGDVIIAANDRRLSDAEAMHVAVEEAGFGGVLRLDIVRGGSSITTSVLLEPRPQTKNQAA